MEVTTSDIFEKSSETIPTQQHTNQQKTAKAPYGKPTFSFDVAQPKKVEVKLHPTTPHTPATATPQRAPQRAPQRTAYVPPKAAPIHG